MGGAPSKRSTVDFLFFYSLKPIYLKWNNHLNSFVVIFNSIWLREGQCSDLVNPSWKISANQIMAMELERANETVNEKRTDWKYTTYFV